MKQLWMLVGGNGAGKTTFYEQFLRTKNLPFINADVIARERYPEAPAQNSRKAAQLAAHIVKTKLREGLSFCFETVFSHPSKIDVIAGAKALGYRIFLIWIHIENSELNIARVAQRVEEGGHDVPVTKITTRIPRTIGHVKAAVSLCDEVWVFDNSRLDSPYQRVLTIVDRKITYRADPLPEWAKLFD